MFSNVGYLTLVIEEERTVLPVYGDIPLEVSCGDISVLTRPVGAPEVGGHVPALASGPELTALGMAVSSSILASGVTMSQEGPALDLGKKKHFVFEASEILELFVSKE